MTLIALQAPSAWLQLATLVTLCGIAGCDAVDDLSNQNSDDLRPSEQSQPRAALDEQEPPRQVRVYRVPHFATNQSKDFVARVDAAQTIDLAFEVSGTLIDLPVREGQTIARGRPVATLAQTDFKLAVKEAQVQLRLKRNDLQRKTSLLARRGISQAAVDEAQGQAVLAAVKLSQAQESLRETQLLAPFDAYVAKRLVDNHSNVLAAIPIVRLLDLSELHLRANLPEALLATLTADNIVSLTAHFAFIPEQTFELRYLEHSGEADDVAQTYEVTFAMKRPTDYNLLPGMTANIALEYKDTTGAGHSFEIPTSALVTDASGDLSVWLLDEGNNRVRRQSVRATTASNNRIRVTEGLAGNELVVSSGTAFLQNNMRIVPLAL